MRPPRDWDERYAGEDYAFGTEPNAFLVQAEPRLPRGRVLSLAEGEGRNAVWLAARGFEVHSVDGSAVGVAKTLRLAAERGVTVRAGTGRLEDLVIAPDAWDVIVSIFAHTPRPVRAALHAKVVRGLAPGGVYVLEAYRPEQLGRGTGGPPDPALMPSLADLRAELAGLELVHAVETEREVLEGRLHTGAAAVVQVLARRAG